MKNKIFGIVGIYFVPVLCGLITVFLKDIKINGEEAGLLASFALGFFIGSAIEGFLFMLTTSYGVITGRSD